MIHYKVVNHMDIEIVKKYIYIYKVPQITVKNSVSRWFNTFIQRITYRRISLFTIQKVKIIIHYNTFTVNEDI